ncbi:MAG: hypothetical protein ACRYFE_02960 [Janthinobacterium lividum]
MRIFAHTALIAGAATLVMAGSAWAQPEAVSVTIAPEFASDAQKLGQREVDQQVSDIIRTVERTLTRQDALDGAKIDLVIKDLKPNRPTIQQLSDRPGLDAMRSLSIGGASFEGTVTLADGTVQPVKYSYYSPTIRDAVGATTWHDASRAYDRLANNLANGRFVTR